MNSEITRRRFLKVGATAASASILSGTLLSDIAGAAPLGVRRNLGGMSATDPVLLTYRRGIKAMKALPQSDPRSWIYQAAIHGTLIAPPLLAWNTCQHGALFFWSWHRMYLYWFERIVRKMAGDCDPCWSLPYWDWTSPTQRPLPAPFRETTSDLFHAARNAAMNNGTGSLSAAATSIAGPFALVDFVGASGGISFGPHGAVHVGVGGDMGSVARAAQDPLFYVHHCNVDRLWNLWIAQGGGRSNPLGDAAWRTTKYTFFTENGVEVAMTSCQVLRAAEQLDYVYEGEPDQVRQYCERRIRFPIFDIVLIAQFRLPRIVLSEKPTPVPLPLETAVRQRLRPLATSTTENVLLVLEDVEADRPPGVFWEVHLGAVKPESASVDSPTFLGTLALFGEGIKSEGHHETKPTRVVFPIRAQQLTALAASARTTLTFIPRGIVVGSKAAPAKPDAPISIGRVSIAVQTRKEVESPVN